MRNRINKIIFSVAIATCLLTAVHFAFAQTPINSDTAFGGATGQTAETLAANAGLGTSDPREVVARVINVILGFLGIIAVALIIYAGFLWMTAQGNETQITTAKKIMTGAAIGLVIILAAFGIAAFVMRVLLGATGGSETSEACATVGETRACGCGGTQTCGSGKIWGACIGSDCSGSPTIFEVQKIKPPEEVPDSAKMPKNTRINIYFNLPVDSNISTNIIGAEKIEVKKDNTILTESDIEYKISGSQITLTSKGTCANNPCGAVGCFVPGVYSVEVKAGSVQTSASITSKGVQGYTTSPANFTVVDAIDCQDPKIELISNNTQICLDSDNNISANASDDSAVADVSYSDNHDNSAFLADKTIEVFPYEITWRPTVDKGYKAMFVYIISGKATDVVGRTNNNSITKTLRAAHCCDGVKNVDEAGEDCGGADCAACPAAVCGNKVGQCTENNDACASGVCAPNSTKDKCVCQDVPIIDYVSPEDGAVGNLVTIGGRYFGDYDAAKSKVYFTSDDGDSKVEAKLANSVNSQCTGSWQNNQIVVVVPTGSFLGPVKVQAASGYADESNDTRGTYSKVFTVNTVVRPGLCRVVGKMKQNNNEIPRQEFQEPIVLHGINFGNGVGDNNYKNIIFGTGDNSFASLSSHTFAWSPKIIGTETHIGSSPDYAGSGPLVPNISAGITSVKVTVGQEASNALRIKIEGSSRAPFITKIEPVAGHAGDYVTIYGGNFGDSKGEVKFGDKIAGLNFPPECSQKEIWQNSQIIVKAPESLTGVNKINVKVGGLEVEEAKRPDFRVGNYCEKDTKINCVRTDYDSANSNQIVCKRICGASESNCAPYDYGSCITAAKPGLCALTPDNGPVGTEVNFYGERFGADQGTVKFYKDNNSATPIIWEVNKDKVADKAIAAVPKEAISGPAKILNSTAIESNSLNFRVGSCLDSGASGTENPTCKGTGQEYCCGTVTQFAGSCMADEAKCGFVAGSTYAQYYFEFSTQPSTEIPCDGDIVAPACQPNENLCPADRPVCDTDCFCKPPAPPKVVESCDRDLKNCRERLLPSPSPLTPLPTDWKNGKKWTDDGNNLACTNAVITARFDKLIDHSTLITSGANKTIIVEKCDDSNQKCTIVEHSQDKGKEFIISDFKDQTAFIFTPQKLENRASYKVTLTTGIKSIPQLGGLPLEKYEWNFKTKSDNANCGLSCLSVAPASYTASYKEETKEYVATPQQKDNACVILDGSNYTYNWDLKEVQSWAASAQPPQPIYASFQSKAERADNNTINKTSVKAVAETRAGFPVHVIAQTKVGNDSYSGYGALNIKFGDFYVKQEFPVDECTTVCTNAEVGAVFSAGIDNSSLANNVKLFKCTSGKSECDVNVTNDGTTVVPVVSSTANQNIKDRLSFGLGGSLLKADSWYEAVITGGTNGIKSGDGKTLVSTSTRQNINDYRWQFKTGQRACEADKITVTPEPAIATVVGQKIGHKAEASSNSQMCLANTSQILRGNFYNWQWSAANDKVANIKSLIKAGDKNAAGQNVDTVGEGDITQLNADECKLTANEFNADTKGQKTNIIAGINKGDPTEQEQSKDVSGQNNFCLVCGHTADAQCKVMDSNGKLQDANATYGVGKNTCCYPRPYVQSAAPANGATNVCRNALVSVEFNEPMEITSFNGNVLVAAKYDGACPENWPYLLLASAPTSVPTTLSWLEHAIARITNAIARLPLVGQFFNASTALAENYGSNWCVVPGTVGGYNFDGKGYASFAPQDLLKAGSDHLSDHLVLIKGDQNLTDGAHEGVKNVYGVSIGLPVAKAGVICATDNDCKINGKPFFGQIIKFTALEDKGANNNYGICAADKVEMTPASHLFKTKQNNTADDAIMDAGREDIADSDKLFIADTQSLSGQKIVSIAGVYSWKWVWSTDNEQVANVNKKLDDTEFTPNKAIISVAAKAMDKSSTFTRANLEIKDNVYNISGSKEVRGEAEIWVMLCNNPWPAYQENWRPFQDNSGNCKSGIGVCYNTNFEFYYCRDKGSALFNDDLPAISDNGAIRGMSNNIIKEFLFTRAGKPEAPRLMVYTGPLAGTDCWTGDCNGDGLTDNFDWFFQQLAHDQRPLPQNGTVHLIWNGTPSQEYNIYQNGDLLANVKAGVIPTPDDSTSHKWCGSASSNNHTIVGCTARITGLENNTAHTFAVTSIKNTAVGNEESAFSNIVSVTPKRTAGPAAPTNLVASVENNSIKLFWDKSADSDVSNYKVYLGIDKDEENEVRDAGNVNNYAWQNLDFKHTYYFKIIAVADGKESGVSNTVKINLGPVGYWKINEGGTNNIIKDSGAFKINGQITNDVLWDENKFLSFDGSSYINFSASDYLNLTTPVNGFTQSVWVKPTVIGNEYRGIIGWENNNTAADRYPSIFSHQKKVHAGFGTGSSSGRSNKWCSVTTTKDALSANNWTFITVVYNDKKYQIYIGDNMLEELVPENTDNIPCAQESIVPIKQIDIGRVGGKYFKGQIAEVKIYNYVRTPEQIKADYDSAKAKFGK